MSAISLQYPAFERQESGKQHSDIECYADMQKLPGSKRNQFAWFAKDKSPCSTAAVTGCAAAASPSTAPKTGFNGSKARSPSLNCEVLHTLYKISLKALVKTSAASRRNNKTFSDKLIP